MYLNYPWVWKCSDQFVSQSPREIAAHLNISLNLNGKYMFNGPALTCAMSFTTVWLQNKYFSDTFSVNAGKTMCVSVHIVNTTSYIRATVERYHVSQLLHHTLHHLRPVLQQLRGEFLIEPGLRHKHKHTQLSRCSGQDKESVGGLSHCMSQQTPAHFFQFSDQLRRSHNIFLAVILARLAALVKQTVRHSFSSRGQKRKHQT